MLILPFNTEDFINTCGYIIPDYLDIKKHICFYTSKGFKGSIDVSSEFKISLYIDTAKEFYIYRVKTVQRKYKLTLFKAEQLLKGLGIVLESPEFLWIVTVERKKRAKVINFNEFKEGKKK